MATMICWNHARVRVPRCSECDTPLEFTGRNTAYCPSCDTCPTCECPNADGFQHYAGCTDAQEEN